MIRNEIVILIGLSLSSLACAQQSSQPPTKKSTAQPPVRVNMLNVCTPSAEEQAQIASALSRIPKQPLFSQDFEVDRGRSTLDQPPDFLPISERTHVSKDTDSAAWVRIRREFAVQALYATVQYSFSQDARTMVETLVFKVRDPKDLLQVSIEDDASSVTSPAAMLGTDTPVSRIRLERFGKSSIVLARCPATAAGPAPDQSAYEPLFQTASAIDSDYRNLLRVPQTVPEELDRVASVASKDSAKSFSKKLVPRKNGSK